MKFVKVKGKQEWQFELKGVIVRVTKKKYEDVYKLYVGNNWFSSDLDKNVLFERAYEMFDN